MKAIDTGPLFYAKKKLREWGNWCRQSTIMGLDYPSRSLLDHAIESRGRMATRGAKSSMLPNPEAEEVERLILKLNQIDPRQARILYTQYVKGGTKAEKVRQADYAKSYFYELLNKAEQWIADQLYPS